MKYRCKRCCVPIQGDSELCVSCYRHLIVPCSACMTRRGRHGEALVHMHKGKPVDCKVCHNERYVLRDYRPGEAQ